MASSGKEVTMDKSLAQDFLPASGATAYIIRKISETFANILLLPLPAPMPCLSVPSSILTPSQNLSEAEVTQVNISFRPESWTSRPVLSILATSRELGKISKDQAILQSQYLWG